MTDADYIERRALELDAWEMFSRAAGMFDLAVCFQQLAAWARDRTPPSEFRGMNARSLTAHTSNGKGFAAGSIPVSDWHYLARDLTHAAVLKGFPAPPSDEEILAQRQQLEEQLLDLEEAVASIRQAISSDGPL